jgi:hyperosmotically inducible protein
VAGAGLVMTAACAQTDAGITTNVKTKLAADDTVKAYQIDVDTNNGVVTLTGNVETPAAKDQAMLIARQTNGVRDVVDQIVVNPTAATSGAFDRSTDLDDPAANTADRLGDRVESAGQATADKTGELAQNTADKTADVTRRTGEAVADGAITSAVKTRFLADAMVKGLQIDVDTDNGVVTLNGTVSSKAEMDKAMEIAKSTSGVKRVVSNLRMK